MHRGSSREEGEEDSERGGECVRGKQKAASAAENSDSSAD